jgi:hypothetical protein
MEFLLLVIVDIPFYCRLLVLFWHQFTQTGGDTQEKRGDPGCIKCWFQDLWEALSPVGHLQGG